MFDRATNFNNGELSNNGEIPLYLDTTSITSMESMFQDCSSFNQSMPKTVITLELNEFSYNYTSWNMEMTTSLSSMFYKCTSFNGDIGTWNVRNILDFSNMFNCKKKL